MEKVKLGDIAVLINGDRGKNYPSQADITEEGDVPFVNAGHLTGLTIDFGDMNYISKEKYEKLSSGKFEKGDILYCLRGSLGKKAIVNDDVVGAIASSLVIIRPDYEKIDGDYLMFSLDSPSIKEQLVKANNGSSQPNLSAASVREYQIELPDISLQKEVVEKLTRVRNVIDERQKELNLLNELIKARFVELFGDMVINPNDWEKYKLGAVCDVRDGTHDSPQYYTEGYPLVTSKNVAAGRIDLTDCNLICEEDYKKINQRSKVDIGDILMPMIGTVGNPVIVNVEPDFAIKNVALIKFKEDSMVLNSFVKALLESDYFDNAVISKVRGGTQKFISLGDIRNLEICLPPLNRQEQFAEFVKQVDKSKVAVQKALDEAQLLFDSLMQEYFG